MHKHMCARIKFHTCVDSVNTKNSAKSVKEVLKLYYMTVSLNLTHRVASSEKSKCKSPPQEVD
jgi:hypothetical protein